MVNKKTILIELMTKRSLVPVKAPGVIKDLMLGIKPFTYDNDLAVQKHAQRTLRSLQGMLNMLQSRRKKGKERTVSRNVQSEITVHLNVGTFINQSI